MRRLAVSVGCPCGIGPEVSVAAAAKLGPRAARALLVGDAAVVRDAARLVKVKRPIVSVEAPRDAWSLPANVLAVFDPVPSLAKADRVWGKPTKASGRQQLAWIDEATDIVVRGDADALVTGPVNKDVIARSGAKGAKAFRGHTEHLAARLGAREVTMAFHHPGRGLTTSLVTTHLALANVPRAITAQEVARAAFWTATFVANVGRDPRRGKRGRGAPTVAIAALNPHAGEGGLLGDEERTAIAPGIVAATKRLAKAKVHAELVGPVPAESAFRLAADGRFAGVVAMYHDQATIPMKLLGFGDAVNVTLGLPIVRTSVDHGTAYDRAGKGTADASGMIEAMALAVRLSR